jgi:tetratricopeptide (TPR) repeat protein
MPKAWSCENGEMHAVLRAHGRAGFRLAGRIGFRIAGTFVILALAPGGLPASEPSGPELIRQGKFEEALAVYRADIEASPKSVAANNGAGVALDLLGRFTEAQQYFTQAIKATRTPLERAVAQRAMAIAHGFAGDCKGAEKFESDAFDFYLGTSDFFNAGEVADELGRLCLDAGDLNRASEWYRKGHDTGLDQPDMAPARKDLWSFRLAHARARIAARRGKPEEALKYVREARTILDRSRNPDQEQYFPYLTGYVAFYAGDYPAALAALQRASPADPFIQCLMAQTYEALGNREKALEYYRQAANSSAHSVPAAYARPFSRRKLEGFVSK